MVLNRKKQILDYLEKNFKVGFGQLSDGNVSDGTDDFYFEDIFDGRKLRGYYLLKELKTIFDVDYSGLFSIWCADKIRLASKEVIDVLDTYTVRLGRYRWEIKKDGEDFNIKDVYEKLGPLYDETFINRVYHDWYEQKQIEVTEKTTGLI